MPNDLLFEIGCEEIPAKMLAAALAALPGQVKAKLEAARLAHGTIKALGTPRRIAVIVQSLADRQPDLDELVVGPPVSAAFGPDGALSKAGEGFAKKNGVAPEAIAKQEVAGKKGLYAVAQKHVAGEATRMLLPAILKELAAGIVWPKSMKWGWSEQTFVRPVQWLVALYGGEVVRRIRTSTGVPGASTPTGHFAVTDRLSTGVEEGPYGCCVLALSAVHPLHLSDWDGGNRIAIHATNDTEALGHPASHGCAHVDNADGRWLLANIPDGTPVVVANARFHRGRGSPA